MGPYLRNIRGTWAGAVIQGGAEGLITREYVTPKNPQTAAQMAIRANFAAASEAFRNMTPTQLTNWENYAMSLSRTNPVNGRKGPPNAIQVFVGLASKYLQVNPGGAIPMSVPTTGFKGDSVVLTATGGTGKVTFTADKPNASGVTTELLIQRLPSPNRKPSKGHYKTATFFQFQSGTLTKDVTVPPGYYATAYRFVRTSTGQSSNLIPLPTTQIQLAIERGGSSTQKKAA